LPEKPPILKRARRVRLGDAVANYVKSAGRKKRPQIDPNDRDYDPDFQRQLRRLPPDQFDALINGDED
jgi:hypothetical protein